MQSTPDKSETSGLNALSSAALSAAMRGGTADWGRWGSATDHVRYADPWPREHWRRRRVCRCGCGKRVTHTGKANGIALMSGCEFLVRRWVRDGVKIYERR
jgi:hypothetical protein